MIEFFAFSQQPWNSNRGKIHVFGPVYTKGTVLKLGFGILLHRSINWLRLDRSPPVPNMCSVHFWFPSNVIPKSFALFFLCDDIFSYLNGSHLRGIWFLIDNYKSSFLGLAMSPLEAMNLSTCTASLSSSFFTTSSQAIKQSNNPEKKDKIPLDFWNLQNFDEKPIFNFLNVSWLKDWNSALKLAIVIISSQS